MRGLRLPLILKLPKEGTLRTLEQLDGVLKETFVLLNREMDLYRYSPGFPEFTFSILQRLRRVSVWVWVPWSGNPLLSKSNQIHLAGM